MKLILLLSIFFGSPYSRAGTNCGELLVKMAKLHSLASIQDTNRRVDMNTLTTWLNSAYSIYSTNEGRSVRVPYGSFRPLRDTALNFKRGNDRLSKVFDTTVSAKFEEVMQLLPECMNVGPSTSGGSEAFEEAFNQMSGVSGFGKVGSGQCDNEVPAPCINVYLESEGSLSDIRRVYPNGLKIQGVNVRFTVVGEFETL